MKIRCGDHTHELFFCDAPCKEGFEADRALNIVYGCAHLAMNERQGKDGHVCTYCSSPIVGKEPLQ